MKSRTFMTQLHMEGFLWVRKDAFVSDVDGCQENGLEDVQTNVRVGDEMVDLPESVIQSDAENGEVDVSEDTTSDVQSVSEQESTQEINSWPPPFQLPFYGDSGCGE